MFGKQGVRLYICLTALTEFGGSCLGLLTKIGKGGNDILNELRDKLILNTLGKQEGTDRALLCEYFWILKFLHRLLMFPELSCYKN